MTSLLTINVGLVINAQQQVDPPKEQMAPSPQSVNTGVGSLSYLGIPHSDDEIFHLTLVKAPIVIAAWALLALLPKWKYTVPIVKAAALAFAVLYVLLLVDGIIGKNKIDWSVVSKGKYSSPFDMFMSLDGIVTLFSQKSAVFGGWIHYVVFDLWVGIWIAQNSIEIGFPQLLTAPLLFATMMLGPSGLLLYFLLSSVYVLVAPALGVAPPSASAAVAGGAGSLEATGKTCMMSAFGV